MPAQITTVAGEAFTPEDSALLARLIYRRFGYEISAAAAAWRRMLQNNCTDAHFAALVAHGDDVLPVRRAEAEAIVRALADYECRPLVEGERDLSDGACTLRALRPLVRFGTGGAGGTGGTVPR